MKQGKISLSTVQFGIESSLGFDNHNFLKSSNDIFLVRSFSKCNSVSSASLQISSGGPDLWARNQMSLVPDVPGIVR